jgi:hypothetical protein
MPSANRRREIRVSDGLVIFALQLICAMPLLPLKEKGFPLAALLGAFVWGYLTKRRRPDVFRADRVVFLRRIWGRAPMRLLLAPLYATGFASLPYAWYVARSGFDFSAGLFHPVAVKGPGWFVFGAGVVGAILLGLHFVTCVVGVRAAYLAFAIMPEDAGKNLDDP